METKAPVTSIPKDTPSLKAHRRQRFWGITLPVVLAALLVVACVVWLSLGSPGASVNNPALSQALSVLIILPMMAVALIFFVLLAGLVFGLSRLYKVLPGVSAQVLAFFHQVLAYTRTGANMAARPVIAFRSNMSRVNQVITSFDQRIRSKGK